MNQKIINLLNNREFADKMVNLNCSKDIKKLFKEYGVDISDEELSGVFKFKKEIEKDLSALDDRELEEIEAGVEFAVTAKVLGAAYELCKTISDGFENYANFKLADTQLRCDTNVKVTTIENNGKLLRAKMSAANHIIGYALITAIAVAFIRKRKRAIKT